MSKHREPPPPTGSDKTVIPFPGAGTMSPERLRAELAAYKREVDEEVMLRMKYRLLLSSLDQIESLPPVPDDWRARLQGRQTPDEAD